MQDEEIFEEDFSPHHKPQHGKNSIGIILYPILLAAVLAGGYYLGTRQQKPETAQLEGDQQELLKLNRVLNEIEMKYVDSVEQEVLIETSIAGILQNLDPHSSYIPAKNLSDMDDPLRGGFGGVGIRFMILRDTLMITNVIENGPSQKVGMRAGDRIIAINDTSIAGVGIKNEDVFVGLKGKIGTRVKVGVYRPSTDENLTFNVVRDLVAIKSIESEQMVTEDIGYIKLARFAEPTPTEFALAARKLQLNGMKKLILDLRDNGGGYLHAAVELADHFLSGGKMIVYTEGRYTGRTDYRATSRGLLENIDVAILINSSTASASEIVSGAVQDNDRGIVLGRRSYGKGLVQEPIQLSDGSGIRLTVARYYTPSGRCIQRPYGNGVDYHSDLIERYENGEFYQLDSSSLDGLEKFTTSGGRTVYGGGGILPDVFIPVDTAGASAYLTSLSRTAAFSEFAFGYVDGNRRRLRIYRNAKAFDERFIVDQKMLDEFLEFAAEKHNVPIDEDGKRRSVQRIKTRLKAHIAQNIWEQEGWFTVYISKDREVKQAIEEIQKL